MSRLSWKGNLCVLFEPRPDSTASISIVYACSQAGLIEGCRYFSKMEEKFSIEPASIEHYNCIVALYGRAGPLHRTKDFILKMLIPPNA